MKQYLVFSKMLFSMLIFAFFMLFGVGYSNSDMETSTINHSGNSWVLEKSTKKKANGDTNGGTIRKGSEDCGVQSDASGCDTNDVSSHQNAAVRNDSSEGKIYTASASISDNEDVQFMTHRIIGPSGGLAKRSAFHRTEGGSKDPTMMDDRGEKAEINFENASLALLWLGLIGCFGILRWRRKREEI
jgi:hypothetical protein